jgi:hypothetical protein
VSRVPGVSEVLRVTGGGGEGGSSEGNSTLLACGIYDVSSQSHFGTIIYHALNSENRFRHLPGKLS